MRRTIERVLIANRGEIAVRVIRACRELGIETVQAYSEADRDMLAIQLADHAVCIGPARSRDSYLNAESIVSAALVNQADAIHPGYGFLSENAAFARLCEREGVIFIGPHAAAIEQMGDKATARRLARAADVPTTPGSEGTVANAGEASAIASRLGYPVILKASAGGGGRGMRVVRDAKALPGQFASAAKEGKAAFGSEALYVEKYLSEARHIEIQILSDGENVLHLGERDCSVQRRNQKLLEESPSPVLTEEDRRRIGDAAVRLCRHVRYTSAGTIEFMLDAKTGEFYFMEMNTRIQVEHPVTEFVTGVDLVKAQIRIAAGEPLAMRQSDIHLRGHAIECRINAEDFRNQFMPCPGQITRFLPPGGPGVRVDSHVYSGYVVPPFYDSLIAKVIVWGEDRREAIVRMQRALGEMTLEGVATTIPFHQHLLRHDSFLSGAIHTSYVEQEILKKP